MPPTIAEIVKSENTYTARAWNRELATRYVLETDSGPVEASHFMHFSDSTFVKQVIELPISFGCPVRCGYCASGSLPGFRPLKASDLVQIVDMLATIHAIAFDSTFRLSFSGIGESSLASTPIIEAAQAIHSRWPLATFAFTTVGIRPSFIELIDELATQLPIHVLQISLVHTDSNVVSQVIPTVRRYSYSFSDVIDAVGRCNSIRVRFNYVLIAGINDDDASIVDICEGLGRLCPDIVVRVSQMNETGPSTLNRLQAPSFDGVHRAVQLLCEYGFQAYAFASHRNDNLNCGQLAGTYLASVGMGGRNALLSNPTNG